jgi:hypothetical protein
MNEIENLNDISNNNENIVQNSSLIQNNKDVNISANSKTNLNYDQSTVSKLNNTTGSLEAQNKNQTPPVNYAIKFNSKLSCLIFSYIITMISQYIIIPLLTIMKLVFLNKAVYVDKDKPEFTYKPSISIAFIIIGYLIIFLVPFINLFSQVVHIFLIDQNFLLRVWNIIINLTELIFQIPLTFMLPYKKLSIYLFQQKGDEVYLLNGCVFYPTDYAISIFNIVRIFIDGIYYFVIGLLVLFNIKDNYYFEFYYGFVILFLVMNGYQIIYGFFLIYWKCVFGLSEIRYGNMSLTKKNYCDKNIDDNKNK